MCGSDTSETSRIKEIVPLSFPALPTAHLSDYRVVMRRPDRAELDLTMLLFLTAAPMVYFAVRGLIALTG
jgi:hypothetical protein